jgi:putative ABC transport system substrate-binding protein
MKRRNTMGLLLALGTLQRPASAQQPARAQRIGWLAADSVAAPASKSFIAAFRKGMDELKWVEGRDYVLDVRYANDNPQATPGLADELVASRPDLVFAISVDPVGSGLVESLQRPGGNVTGMTNQLNELGPKRLQLLKEAFPRVAHVGVPYEPNEPSSAAQAKTVEDAAKVLGLRITLIELRQPADITPAFERAAALGVQAYLPVAGRLVVSQRQEIIEQVLRTRLPAIYTVSQYPDSGGLTSYGSNVLDNFRRAAGFVDKILKGTRPGDLPTQQPTQYEMVINLKTARAMGLAMPQSVMLRADRVIE